MKTTRTTTRRLGAALVVAALLAGGQPAVAQAPNGAPPPRLTLGGQPLAQILQPSPARPVSGFHLPPMAPVVVPPLRGRVKSAVAGAALGLIPAFAVTSHCHNEGGSSCWQGFGLVGLGALAGYALGRLFERPLRAGPAWRWRDPGARPEGPRAWPPRTRPGARDPGRRNSAPARGRPPSGPESAWPGASRCA